MAKKKLKKDFDRDQMYSKIMPSMQAEPDSAAVITTPYVIPEPEQEPMAEAQTEPLFPHNYMEDLLLEKMDNTMKVLRACGCERCRKDILALALNGLPPAYAVTLSDETAERVKQLRREFEVKGTAVLIKAIQQVKSQPRH